MDITVKYRKSAGKHIMASTNLCTAMSNFPPMNPDRVPTIIATNTQRPEAPSPTITEVRAPKITRLNTSRPMRSVPKMYVDDDGTNESNG
ncbi:unnamed protein product [marine sediment metagenome]|uniref:Uncharacterized protein n=1 Tax=marine sediment metagenome TaxID=412755 RepID=X1LV10_9ZZZZ